MTAAAAVAWEYQTVPVVAAGFEDAVGLGDYHTILNEHGGQGWELVSAVGCPGQTVEGAVVLFFKRPAG